MYQIEIPIKPHLKKFIAHYVNIQPYVLSRKEPFGSTIYHELSYPFTNNKLWYENLQEVKNKYRASFMVQIDTFTYNNHKSANNLTERAAVAINSYVGALFRFHWHFFADTILELDPLFKQKDLAKKFMDKYNIDPDDFDTDSLLRDYRRYKERNSKKINKKRLFVK